MARRALDDVTAPDGLGSEEVLSSFAETLPDGPTITVLDGKTPGALDSTEPVRVEPGHNFFVAGDNRDRSLDSRFLDHGLRSSSRQDLPLPQRVLTLPPHSPDAPYERRQRMKAALSLLLIASLAGPAFALDSISEPPADFDQAAWQAEWDRGDTDGDGRLSRDEVAAANSRALEIFDKIDRDSDGYLSPEEDKAALFQWYRERKDAAVKN